MRKKQKNLIAVLALLVVGLMVSPVLAKRQYRSSLAGPTRWVSVSEPAYDGRDISTQPVTTVEQENDVANAIEGTGEFIGDVVDQTAGVAGEAGDGILTWVGDVASAAGEIFGGTLEFIFGGWGCPRET